MKTETKTMLFINLGDVQLGLYVTRGQLEYIGEQVRTVMMELDISTGRSVPDDDGLDPLGAPVVKVRIAE